MWVLQETMGMDDSELSMRVVVDYYFLWRQTEQRYETLKMGGMADVVLGCFGIRRFGRPLMWVLKETMGMERSQMLCKPRGHEDGLSYRKCWMVTGVLRC